MKITKQYGGVVTANNIELLGCKIRCIPDDDHRRRVICGVYATRLRATEVFVEMTGEGWDAPDYEYVMPLA